ncbi:MAG: hypothetical protein QXX83_05580 [Thermofilum sp.]
MHGVPPLSSLAAPLTPGAPARVLGLREEAGDCDCSRMYLFFAERLLGEALELSLAENIRQNTLTPEEVGRGLARLYELGVPEEEIARRLLVELDTIRRAIRLYSRLSAVVSLTAESKPGRPPPARAEEAREQDGAQLGGEGRRAAPGAG